jgi:hypothetical protein
MVVVPTLECRFHQVLLVIGTVPSPLNDRESRLNRADSVNRNEKRGPKGQNRAGQAVAWGKRKSPPPGWRSSGPVRGRGWPGPSTERRTPPSTAIRPGRSGQMIRYPEIEPAKPKPAASNTAEPVSTATSWRAAGLMRRLIGWRSRRGDCGDVSPSRRFTLDGLAKSVHFEAVPGALSSLFG